MAEPATELQLLTWKIRAGAWTAITAHGGLDVLVVMCRDQPGTGCPCSPQSCAHPGVPWVTVYATASVGMTTIPAGTHCDLVTQQESLHVLDPDAEPGETLNTVAQAVVIAAAAWGREALAELAGHAERLGLTGEAERDRLTAENERLRARLRDTEDV